MEIGTVINGQLLTGCNNFAGEVKFLSLPLAERVHLSRIPEGTQKRLALLIQAIMSILSSPVIVIYNDLLLNYELLKTGNKIVWSRATVP